MTPETEARRILRHITAFGRPCAVYVGDRGHVLIRPERTLDGCPSKLVDTAIDKGALTGVYDPTCKSAWLAEDLQYVGLAE